MRLADEVRDQLEAFVKGSLSAHELAGWLDSVAPELHAASEEHLRSVVGQVYVLLAELGYGDRTAESTRTEVATLIRQADAPRIHRSGQADTIIPGITSRSS